MKIDSRHLAQLSTIVETGSFQGAADRLGISQPALSRNMSLLESRLKAPIFRRSGRKAIPTELGLRLARAGELGWTAGGGRHRWRTHPSA